MAPELRSPNAAGTWRWIRRSRSVRRAGIAMIAADSIELAG
jgi:hypothetical protein